MSDLATTATGAIKTDGSAVTQPVSGSVSVGNFPATQPVSGTITSIGSTSAGTSASAATGTGANSTVDLGAAYKCVSLQISGTSTIATISLEGSLDNTTFVQLASTSAGVNVTAGLFVVSSNIPVRYVRSNITLISNGNVTSKVMGA